MNGELERLRRTEIWIAWVRVFAVPVRRLRGRDRRRRAPARLRALGAGRPRPRSRSERSRSSGSRGATSTARPRGRIGFLALAFDTAIVYAFVFVHAFEPSTPAWGILYIPVIEGALRYGIRGGAIMPVVVLPLPRLAEWWRAEEFGPPPFDPDHVTLPVRPAAAHRPRRRLARRPPAHGDGGRGGSRRRGRGPARRARAPRGPARRAQPHGPRARIVTRPGPGVRGVQARAPAASSPSTDSSSARGGRRTLLRRVRSASRAPRRASRSRRRSRSADRTLGHARRRARRRAAVHVRGGRDRVLLASQVAVGRREHPGMYEAERSARRRAAPALRAPRRLRLHGLPRAARRRWRP